MKLYGICQKEVIVILKIRERNNSRFYCARMSEGGPTFEVLSSEVFVPKDQTAIKLLYSKKVS